MLDERFVHRGYEHGAIEPTKDYWEGADFEAARLRLISDYLAFRPVRKRTHENVKWIVQADAEGKAVMDPFRASVGLEAKLVARRGYGLYCDRRELRRLSRASKDTNERIED